jgi:hypothetical protein
MINDTKKYENMDDYMFDNETSFYDGIFESHDKMREFQEMWENFFSLENLENKEKEYKKCENTLRILNSIDYQFDGTYNMYTGLLTYAEQVKNAFFEEATRNGEISKFKETYIVEGYGTEYTNPYHKILSCLTLNREKTDIDEGLGKIKIQKKTFIDIFGFDKKDFDPERLCKNKNPVILYIYKFLIFDLTPAVYEFFCEELLNDPDPNVKKNLKYIVEYCIKINSPKKLIQFMEAYAFKNFKDEIFKERFTNTKPVTQMYCYFVKKTDLFYREFTFTPIIRNVVPFHLTTGKYKEADIWDLEFDLDYDEELLKRSIKIYKDSENDFKPNTDGVIDESKIPKYQGADEIIKQNFYKDVRDTIKQYTSDSVTRKNRVVVINQNEIVYDLLDTYIECLNMRKRGDECTTYTRPVLHSLVDFFIHLNTKQDGTHEDENVHIELLKLREENERDPNPNTYHRIIQILGLDLNDDLNTGVHIILQKFYLIGFPMMLAKSYLGSFLTPKTKDNYGFMYPFLLISKGDIIDVLNRQESCFFDEYNYNIIQEFIKATLKSYDVDEEDITFYIDTITPVKGKFQYITYNYILNISKNVIVTIHFFDIKFGQFLFELSDILLGTLVNVSISKNIDDLENVKYMSKCLIAWNPLLEEEKEKIKNSETVEDSEVLTELDGNSGHLFYDVLLEEMHGSFTDESIQHYELMKQKNKDMYDGKIEVRDTRYLEQLELLKTLPDRGSETLEEIDLS